MPHVYPLEADELSQTQLTDYEVLVENNHATNMQRTLIRDHATFVAYDAWHLSWDSLVEIIGERTAIVFAHAISEANECQLCSLYFVADLRQIGLEPHNFELTEQEKVLTTFARAIVDNPGKIPEAVYAAIHDYYTPDQIVTIVGFAGQMIATNVFNSVIGVELDGRLLPLRDSSAVNL